MTLAGRLVVNAWPRMMKRATAAAYCDLSEPAFLREVACGRLPEPVTLGGSEHWSQRLLDDSLARLTGEGDAPADDWRKGSPLYARS